MKSGKYLEVIDETVSKKNWMSIKTLVADIH